MTRKTKNTNFKKEVDDLGYRTPDKLRKQTFKPNTVKELRSSNKGQSRTTRKPKMMRTRNLGGHR